MVGAKDISLAFIQFFFELKSEKNARKCRCCKAMHRSKFIEDAIVLWISGKPIIERPEQHKK